MRFTRKKNKRTRVKLNPKQADEIIKQEFTDSRGNKFIFRIIGKPHSPQEPTIKGTVEYKDEEQ